MSRWFRVYSDLMRSPKVSRLSDVEFRLWIEMMSVASENDGLIPPLDDLKHVLKRRLDHLSRGLDALIKHGLIDALEDGYEPHNWGKFQYKSDTSTDRVAAHRKKRNVSVTPPDTDTDTEKKEKVRAIAARLPADWKPSESDVDFCKKTRTDLDVATTAASFSDYWAGVGGAKGCKLDWSATWRNWVRDQRPPRGSPAPRQKPDNFAAKNYGNAGQI